MSETKAKDLKMKIIVDENSLNQQVSVSLPLKRIEKNQLEYICVMRKMNGENQLTLKHLLAEVVRQYLEDNKDILQALSTK